METRTQGIELPGLLLLVSRSTYRKSLVGKHPIKFGGKWEFSKVGLSDKWKLILTPDKEILGWRQVL